MFEIMIEVLIVTLVVEVGIVWTWMMNVSPKHKTVNDHILGH